ncbi:hypothetical protein AB0442_37605 [Kitasatospora sp. NPDC085895]|uniref:hypothetical protein n=1 Tax=Kitasatospora sp. NPDC085895 TaxID=3155057 RepID=UPI0034507CC4
MAAGTVQDYIGVRTSEEVCAAAALAAGPARDGHPQARGAAAVHRWLLDPHRPAPLTGTRHAELHDSDLAIEERAALCTARNPDLTCDERAFARGAARALGWVLGFAPLDS